MIGPTLHFPIRRKQWNTPNSSLTLTYELLAITFFTCIGKAIKFSFQKITKIVSTVTSTFFLFFFFVSILIFRFANKPSFLYRFSCSFSFELILRYFIFPIKKLSDSKTNGTAITRRSKNWLIVGTSPRDWLLLNVFFETKVIVLNF